MKYCKNCGNELDDNAFVCPKCGVKAVEDSPQETETSSTNGLAIAGLVCSFLIPIVGLILSIVGLNKSKQLDGSGKGLAIAGIVISAVIMVISLIISIVMIVNGTIFLNEHVMYY